MASVPNRGTSERELDSFNQQLRASPLYQNFMRSRGLPTDGRVKLSRSQQSQLEKEMARAGFQIPSGMHIDQGGNLNQKNRLVRNVGIAAGLAAGGYFAAPYIAGALAGSGGAGGAAASVPGAVSGAVPTVASGVGSSLTAVPTVVGGSSAALGGTGAALGGGTLAGATTYGGFGATAPVFGSTVAPSLATGVTAPVIGGGAAATGGGVGLGTVAGGGGTAATVGKEVLKNTPKGNAMAGLTSDQWINIGGRVMDPALAYFGMRSQAGASDRASELTYKTNQELLAMEREKQAELDRQQRRKEAIENENFRIAQEERLENLRRLEQLEAQRDPARLGREQAYRAYMKKYYGYDTGPSVGRVPRTIADGTKIEDVLAQNTKMPAGGSKTLAALTQYGNVLPDPSAQVAYTPASSDPYMGGYQVDQTAMPYRRTLQRGDY